MSVFQPQISNGLIWNWTPSIRGDRRVEVWNVMRGLQVNSRQCWAVSREGRGAGNSSTRISYTSGYNLGTTFMWKVPKCKANLKLMYCSSPDTFRSHPQQHVSAEIKMTCFKSDYYNLFWSCYWTYELHLRGCFCRYAAQIKPPHCWGSCITHN